MRNLEVKVPLDDRADMEARVRALGAAETWVRRQRDTFFAAPLGYLKLREADGALPELIAYRRAGGVSNYDVAPLDDAARWHRLLGRALAVEAVVAKERTLWMYEHTRIHLDRVAGLGDFLELETVVEGLSEDEAQREHDHVIELLALPRDRFIDVPYRALLPGP